VSQCAAPAVDSLAATRMAMIRAQVSACALTERLRPPLRRLSAGVGLLCRLLLRLLQLQRAPNLGQQLVVPLRLRHVRHVPGPHARRCLHVSREDGSLVESQQRGLGESLSLLQHVDVGGRDVAAPPPAERVD